MTTVVAMTPAPINPIIPGFSPDPSAVRVDGWFFLVTSTFHLFPGLPIYASKDLLSWKQIGNAIHRQSQLSLRKSFTHLFPQPSGQFLLSTGGLFAPTIRYHEGTFYIICTNVIRESSKGEERSENFIISTTDIWSGQWSDPVYFEFKGIDPSLLFDSDGKVYVQGSRGPGPGTKINQFEIDVKTGKKLSEERTIWEGTGGPWPEGPHLYKKDNGWYYLLISEGGTFDDHMITVARSQDPWGPYEECPRNPILTAQGTDEYVQFTGHCDMLQDETGRWWGVCLGGRRDPKGRYIMGRETFLTPGTWEGDWPTLEQVKINPQGVQRAEGSAPLSAAPMVDYLYIRDADLGKYKFGDSGSSVTLSASTVDLSHLEESPTFVGRRQRLLNGRSEATITITEESKAWAGLSVKTGLACYKEEYRYTRIFYDASDSSIVFELVNKAKDITRKERKGVDAEALVKSGSLSVRIEHAEHEYRLVYRLGNAGDWTCLGVVDTMDLTGLDFVGPVMGVFAVAGEDGALVHMKDLEVE